MKLVFRQATLDDLPAIEALHREQQDAQSTGYELPDLRGRQIIITIVGCDAEGVIRQCFYCEAVAELRFVGCDPRATALSQREADQLCYVLRQHGFRWLECFVPQKLKAMIRKPLLRARFKDKSKELAYFSRDLRG